MSKLTISDLHFCDIDLDASGLVGGESPFKVNFQGFSNTFDPGSSYINREPTPGPVNQGEGFTISIGGQYVESTTASPV